MIVDFRIDFGYQYTYSRRHYHPVYIWDGELTVDGGKIEKSYRLNYPYMWFGCAQSAKEVELDAPKWQISTKRGITGLRFIADVDEDAVFHFRTTSFDFDFTAKEVIEKGKIENVIGPKYQRCFVDVTKTGYYWYMPEKKPGQTILYAKDTGLESHNWARIDLAWLKPEQSLDIPYEVKNGEKDYQETLFHLVAMPVPNYCEQELPITARINYELYCDGKVVKTFFHSYRFHDGVSQLIEDTWVRVSLPAGTHILTLKNKHPRFSVGINRIIISEHEFNHGQLSLPIWTISGQTEMGKVFAVKDGDILVKTGKEKIIVKAKRGWNEFFFIAKGNGFMKFSTKWDKAQTEVIVKHNGLPVKVGYDLTVVPHDESGWMDWLIDYTYRTKLGNYLLFRSFLEGPPVQTEEEGGVYGSWANHVDGENNLIEFMPTVPANDTLMETWGNMCKARKIFVSDCRTFMSGALKKGAGEYFHDCGLHEFPGAVYAFDPREPYASSDMKEASQKFIAYLKEEIDKTKTMHDVPAFGDSSGGIRYSYLAGAKYVRAETMVCHTQLLLSSARPVSQALGDGRWAVHIAIQHTFFANKKEQLGQYFLSLMQPWMMGADCIYEEDSLFSMFKEERQAWDDWLTKSKRDMTRNFYKFTQQIPRLGKNQRNIGFIDGRYAAPFNGIICDKEQDPHYSVWGLFGNKDNSSWGHTQPEKCRQILELFMPGASTHPFRQKFDKRRFFFSGTPYGDFDAIPVEATKDFYSNYKLLLHLGWNTMLEEDYDKLKSFVENGGTLVTGIPQFSTHVKRDFLADMQDLALYNDGDLSDIAGIKILGKGVKYSGQWNAKDKLKIKEQELSAMPNDNIMEDGEAFLAEVQLNGAEIVAYDMQTAKPMLVRYKLKKGYVYTFTLWAYPGHELFRQFTANWVGYFAENARDDVYIEDKSGEVWWTTWVNGNKKQIMLLNTDYMTMGCEKKADLVIKDKSYLLSIKEGVAYVIDIDNDCYSINEYTL